MPAKPEENPMDMEAFTMRLRAIDTKHEGTQKRAQQATAKANGAVQKLKRTTSDSRTRFCIQAFDEEELEDEADRQTSAAPSSAQLPPTQVMDSGELARRLEEEHEAKGSGVGPVAID